MNYWAILTMTVLSFALGSVWFSTLFGKTWRKIHGAENKTAEEMKEAMKGSKGLMFTEFMITLVMNIVLYLFVQITTVPLLVAFILWLGFVLPATTSGIIWGNDEKRFMFKKIIISSAYRLVVLLVSAYVFFMW